MDLLKILKHLIITTLILILLPSLSFAKKAEKPSARAITHNNKGVTALYGGEVDKAIFEFKTATELNPKYTEAWSNLGVAYKHKGRLEDAIVALKKAILLDKKYASPYNHLGTVYFALKNYKEALKYYNLALKYNKKYSDAYYNAALVYLEYYRSGHDKENLLKAADQLKAATLTNSEHPYAHHELAKVYQEMGEIEQAIIRYKLALEISPELTDAWMNLAKLYTQTGQTLKAQQALNHAMKSNPDSPQAHLNMGMNYLRDDNYRMAINEFNKVILSDPTNEFAYFNTGFAFYKLATSSLEKGDSQTATQAFLESNKAYESALKLKPTYHEAAYNVGYNFQLMKNYEEAIEWYEKTIAVDANFHKAYFSLGIAYKILGKTNEAAKAFCSFVKLKPEGADEDVKTADSFIASLGGCPK